MATIPFPGIPTQVWMDALVDATRNLRDTYPDDGYKGGRIENAAFLVLDGQVRWQTESTALVTASDGQHEYSVNGKCQCDDYLKGRAKYCKHMYARALYRAVQVATCHLHPSREYTVEERDKRAAQGNLCALVCNGAIGEVTTTYYKKSEDKWVTETHAVGYGDRNGGQHVTTANR